MKKYILILFLFLTPVLSILGQSALDKSVYYDKGGQLFYNIFYFPLTSSDSIEINLIYRVSYNTLVFKKQSDINSVESFIALPKFELELKDKDGIIRKRTNQQDTIIIFDETLTLSNKIEHFGIMKVNVAPWNYTGNFRLWDGVNLKIVEAPIRTIDIEKFTGPNGMSEPLICYADNDSDTSSLYPYIFNGTAEFSSKSVEFHILINKNEDKQFFYEIEFLDINKSDMNWDGETSLRNEAKKYTNSLITSELSENLPVYKYMPGSPLQHGYKAILEIAMLPDRIVPGNYRLKVWANESSDTNTINFKIIWYNMPKILGNPDYAADIMKIILTDKEFSDIKSGSRKERLRKIFDWWAEKDPTRFTIYNEAMVEFFRRADYAAYNFRTNFEKEGAKSDRGKVYILYGEPASANRRMMNTGEAVEIWDYPQLNKQFVFETARSGVVFLKEIKTI